jgi:hypothetical protein
MCASKCEHTHNLFLAASHPKMHAFYSLKIKYTVRSFYELPTLIDYFSIQQVIALCNFAVNWATLQLR